ncbi:hypothetical protein [Amycolatopsis sp. NPDC003731]
MRLVRLERQQSRVADDIRAALASLGRGSTVIGGIALVGVGGVTDRPIEAVVLLPHGVIIVIGVDLPDPALRLEAPLGGPWKADGWPLVADDDSVNPATEALDVSQACERRIAELVPGTAPVGTIVAVGPYVETVDQPAADLAGPVRVLHPTPTTMLAATVSLCTAHRPRSVDQVRALIRGLAPSAPEFSDEVLLGEGFSRLTDDAPPESLWDDPPAVAPAAAASAASAVSVGVTGWRTETPAEATPPADAEPTEVLQPAPDRAADPEARPVFPGATSPPAEPTEVLRPPASAEPDRPADPEGRPVFPGTEPSGSADATRSDGPEPAESVAAETERTENLHLPSPSGEQTAAPADSADADSRPAQDEPTTPQAPEPTAADSQPAAAEQLDPEPARAEPGTSPQPAETGQAAPRTAEAPDSPSARPAQTGPTTPRPTEAAAAGSQTAEPQRHVPQAAQAGPSISPQPADATQAAPEQPNPQPTEAEPDTPPQPTAGPTPTQAKPSTPPQPTAGPTPTQAKPGIPPQSTEAGPTPTQAKPGTPSQPAEAAQPNPAPNPRQAPELALPSPQPFPRPRPKPEPATPAPRTVRWLPLGAIGGLVLLAVAAIAVATTGDGTAAAPAPPPPATSQTAPPTTAVRSLQFALRAAGGDQGCASHAFGDAQASLQQTSCSGVKRASYAATIDGRNGAVTVGIVAFPDAAQAAAFKAVADTPGGGGVLDLATETGQWGATPTPRFENAAYASKLDGSSVRLVQAVWVPGPSTADDPGLVRAAKAALDLPAQ